MTAFYNENDPYAAAWLRNLIAAGHIAPGIVDERSIADIEAWELVGFTQCHFFAGIGIWSHALRRAGWPDDRPIWTGSCPCQPFSAAGQRKGISDERHLWPTWSKLIEQCKPPIVIGEQVASKDGLGWLDLVSADMEAAGYAFGASDLCAAGFGGTHIRQRLYFVGMAHHHHQGLEGRAGMSERGNQLPVGSASLDGGLADPQVMRQQGQSIRTERGMPKIGIKETRNIVGLADTAGSQWQGLPDSSGEYECFRETPGRQQSISSTQSSSTTSGLADDESERCDRIENSTRQGRGNGSEISSDIDWLADDDSTRSFERQRYDSPTRHRNSSPPKSGRREYSGICDQRQITSRWLDVDWLLCRNPAGEPSWRPVESGTFPLDNAVAGRMGLLRAYGNALDAETATNFCQVVCEIAEGL